VAVDRRPRAGLTDVAKAAGVSKSTASRALRGEVRVSAETTEHVLAIAASLGYVPDRRAAQLASTAPTTVGLLLRGAERSFYGEIAAQVQTVMDARGLDLLIVNGGDDHAGQMRGVENLLGHRVAGVIYASGRASVAAAEHAASFVPTILVGLDSTHEAIDSVSIDRSSETDLAERVLAAGHRRVAVVMADPPDSATLRERAARYGDVLSEGGAEVIAVRGERGTEFAVSLRAAIEAGATAIMAGDDPTAVEILETLADWGLRSPEDVSVTGFDGVGVYRSSLFGLATVRQPVAQLASAATDLVFERFDRSDKRATHRTFPGEYVPGRTLGPAPRQST
jgi:DNA-binding LacI/PurR family transcriptional regulator